MKNHLVLILLFLFPIIPFRAFAQQYPWPAQVWQERDLVNPAAPHEHIPASSYRFLMGASFRQKSFGENSSAGSLADWLTAIFRIERLAGKAENGKWLLGGRLYFDQFGATELTHGSFRLGWQQNLSKNSSITAAFRFGLESFRLKTSDLYLLQPGDPLQNGTLSSLNPSGGAGIFYQYAPEGLVWGIHTGLSQPTMLRTNLNTGGGSYGYKADLNEWHGLVGGFARLGNGGWIEGSLWCKTYGGQEWEGSASLRYFNNWGRARKATGKHGGSLWAGIGISTFQYLHTEVGVIYEHYKVGLTYDWGLAKVAPLGSLPMQISIAWLGANE